MKVKTKVKKELTKLNLDLLLKFLLIWLDLIFHWNLWIFCRQNLLVKTTSSTKLHQWSWKLGTDNMASPTVDQLWFLNPISGSWWWSSWHFFTSISLANLPQASSQQRCSSGHDLHKPVLHQQYIESICPVFSHLRDVILGMTPPPEVQDGWFKFGWEIEMGIDQPYKLRTVPGSGMENPSWSWAWFQFLNQI